MLQQLDFESCEKWRAADQCYLFRTAASELSALMNEIPNRILNKQTNPKTILVDHQIKEVVLKGQVTQLLQSWDEHRLHRSKIYCSFSSNRNNATRRALLRLRINKPFCL